MREKQLSKRLQAVVSLVTPGRRVADVGCDHAYASIYLMEHGLAKECIALDVREGPLERARSNIAAHRLSGQIPTRLGSGLEPVCRGEIDTVLMAGMGGILVRDLLEGSRELSHSLLEWVLQPQSDVELVRRYIRESGFQIAAEEMVREDGKYYPMFRAVPAEAERAEARKTEAGKTEAETAEAGKAEAGKTEAGKAEAGKAEAETVEYGDGRKEETEEKDRNTKKIDQEVWDRFGKLLLQRRHPVLYEYLKGREEHYRQVLLQMQENPAIPQRLEKMAANTEKAKEIQQEAVYVRYALQYWENKGAKKR